MRPSKTQEQRGGRLFQPAWAPLAHTGSAWQIGPAGQNSTRTERNVCSPIHVVQVTNMFSQAFQKSTEVARLAKSQEQRSGQLFHPAQSPLAQTDPAWKGPAGQIGARSERRTRMCGERRLCGERQDCVVVGPAIPVRPVRPDFLPDMDNGGREGVGHASWQPPLTTCHEVFRLTAVTRHRLAGGFLCSTGVSIYNTT